MGAKRRGRSGYYFLIVWFLFIQFAVRNKAFRHSSFLQMFICNMSCYHCDSTFDDMAYFYISHSPPAWTASEGVHSRLLETCL